MIELTVKGVEAAAAELDRLADRLEAEFRPALREQAELIMTEAKRRTPVDTGALKGSGHVQDVSGNRPREAAMRLAFGGPAAPYAVPVHENLSVHHGNGEAKFLERPFLEAIPGLAMRIARRLGGGARGGGIPTSRR